MIIFKGVAMQPNADAALIDLSVATVDALLPETAGPAATRISDMSIARE